jgi:hypothetical protein
MTAKEKAEELVDKMYYSRKYKDGENYRAQEAWVHAKQCALIAVDEIINSVVITDLTIAQNQFDYWEEVKSELEKL